MAVNPSKKFWDVVIFKKDNSVYHIPSSWAVNDDKTIYLWPKVPISILKHSIEECEPPKTSVSYKELGAVYKGTRNTIAAARRLQETVIESRSTSNESESGSSSVRCEEIEDSFEEEGNDTSGNDDDDTLTFNSDENNKSELAPSSSAVYRSTSKLQNSKAQRVKSGSSLPKSKDVTIATPQRNPASNLRCSLTEDRYTKLMKAIAGIEYDLKEIKSNQTRLESSVAAVIASSTITPSRISRHFELPTRNQEDLMKLEEQVKQDTEFENLVSITDSL
ncbi:uncharacterized protein LOC116178422 [Photinus pyralis]|uniref:uncharacterized protein LOC116178422 n=1 Tax=Photinus pyralis TaxID=7054 RepID=UPI001266E874|nr:uncharacterized protein LOC116178422 [Photinus pyralis]